MKPLFATIVGSKLYGLSTPQSDTDFKGFAFPEIDELIGLKRFEQQQYKDNETEDGPDKVEGSIYSVSKYINLCLKGNPTVIEISFADPQYHLYNTDVGQEVLDFIQNNMLTKHLFKPYSSYHRAQMRKLQSMNRTGKRKKDVDKHGYDPKFASHAYRLARQCIIVMKEGTLRPTLDPEDRETALRIRKGSECYSREEILDILRDSDEEMYNVYKKSSLPANPDFNKANKFLMDLHQRYLKGEFKDLMDRETFDKTILNNI